MFAKRPSTADRSASGLSARKIIVEETILRLILRFSFIICTVSLLSTSVEADSPQRKNSEQEEIVSQLYRDFAWEAVMHQPSWIGLMDQPRGILERYFDKKLTTLILQDRTCAKKEGVCRLNFLPIWGSQDPSASDLEVQQSDKAHIALAKFRYPSTDEMVTLMYQLTKTSKGWRISDISGIMNGTKWSLLSILESQK
jgi:hypothetical protein